MSCHSCSLSELCLPRGLSEAEMEELDSVVERNQSCERDDSLYRGGDRLEAIYAIRSGSFKTTITTSGGAEQVIGFYLPGELLGLDGFADEKHRCNVIALESATVCELTYPDFEKLCGQLSGLRRQMVHLVGREINNSNRMLLALGQMSAEERLAAFLMSFSIRFGERGFSDAEFNLSMPRHDLANYLGVAVETVSRLFSRLQDERILVVERRKVRILDKSKLAQLAQLAHDHCAGNDQPMAKAT